MKEDRFAVFEDKILKRDRLMDFVTNFSISPEEINPTLESLESSPIRQKIKLIDIISRPQVTIPKIVDSIPSLKEFIFDNNLREEIIEAAEICIKYEGYIEREKLIADKIARLENIRIKGKFDYSTIQQISIEARQKLAKIDPETIAQASRIPGISPSDINILLVLLGR